MLSAAILVWTGGGADHWPLLSDQRIIDHYGAAAASALLPRLHALKEEFYVSDAWERVDEFTEMQRLSAAEFHLKHPELTEEAVGAFALCYTYDHK